MPPFVRVMVIFIVVGVCLALGVMVVRHYQVRRRQLDDAKRDRAAVAALFERLDHRMRRADIVVGSQLIDGERRVARTTLICRRYAIDTDNVSSIPLTPQIITVAGGSAVVRYWSLNFAPVFKFDQDYADYSGIVAGKTIYFFDSIRSTDPKDEGSPLADRLRVLQSCQVDPLGQPSAYEKELWHKIWDLTRETRTNLLAGQRGLQIQEFKSPAIPLKPGVVYRIWIEGSEQPMIHQEDDPVEISDMMRAMRGHTAADAADRNP